MYPYQLLIAIDNDRLRAAGRRLRQAPARGPAARPRQSPRRALIQVFRPRAAAEAVL